MPPSASPVAVCLSTDPGTTRHALAHMALYPTGAILVEDVCYIELGVGGINVRNQLLRLRPTPTRPEGFFSVETIDGIVFKGRDPRQIHLTKANEGRMKLLAEQMGIRFVETRAAVWRKLLLGSGTASDAQIRAGVEGLYEGPDRVVHLPAMNSVEREHCLDAIGLGYVELVRVAAESTQMAPGVADRARRMLLIPGALLPDRARAEVALAKMQEKSDRETKALAKQLGFALPRKAPRKQARIDAINTKVQAQTTRFLKRLRGT